MIKRRGARDRWWLAAPSRRRCRLRCRGAGGFGPHASWPGPHLHEEVVAPAVHVPVLVLVRAVHRHAQQLGLARRQRDRRVAHVVRLEHVAAAAVERELQGRAAHVQEEVGRSAHAVALAMLAGVPRAVLPPARGCSWLSAPRPLVGWRPCARPASGLHTPTPPHGPPSLPPLSLPLTMAWFTHRGLPQFCQLSAARLAPRTQPIMGL